MRITLISYTIRALYGYSRPKVHGTYHILTRTLDGTERVTNI